MALFGLGKDPYKEAQKSLSKVEPMLHQYYDPYVEYGQRAMPTLEQQYAALLGDPGALYAQLGAGYQQSPGYQFAMDEAMRGASTAAGAGGMLGTPSHQYQSADLAQQLANRDYQNYMANMLDLYGRGLSGTEGQLQTGYGATGQLASGLGGLYGSQANLGAAQAASQNQMLGSILGGLTGMSSWF